MPGSPEILEKLDNLNIKVPSFDGFLQFANDQKAQGGTVDDYDEVREQYFFSLDEGFKEYYNSRKNDPDVKYDYVPDKTGGRLNDGNGSVLSEAYASFIISKTYETENDLFRNDIRKEEKEEFIRIVTDIDPNAILPSGLEAERKELSKKAQQTYIRDSFTSQSPLDAADVGSFSAFWGINNPRHIDSVGNFYNLSKSAQFKSFRSIAKDIGGSSEALRTSSKELFYGTMSALLRNLDGLPEGYAPDMSDKDIVEKWSKLNEGSAFFMDHKLFLDALRPGIIEYETKRIIKEKYGSDLPNVLAGKFKDSKNTDLKDMSLDDLERKFAAEYASANKAYDGYYQKCAEINAKQTYLERRLELIASPYYSFTDTKLPERAEHGKIMDGFFSATGYNEQMPKFFTYMAELKSYKFRILTEQLGQALNVKHLKNETDLTFRDEKGNKIRSDEMYDIELKRGKAFSVTYNGTPHGEKVMVMVDPKGKVLVDPDADVLKDYAPPKKPGLWTRFLNLFKAQPECTQYKKDLEMHNDFKSNFAAMKRIVDPMSEENVRERRLAQEENIKKYSEELKKAINKDPLDIDARDLAFAKLMICSESKRTLELPNPRVESTEVIEERAAKKMKDPLFRKAVGNVLFYDDSASDLTSGDPEKVASVFDEKESRYKLEYQRAEREHLSNDPQNVMDKNGISQSKIVDSEEIGISNDSVEAGYRI